jgi:DNA (cytosine-5)-methyltransferase 1
MVVAARMVAFGEYSVDGTASAMKARDYKDATDLVAQPIALQDTTTREKAQNGRGWNDDGTAYTVDTHATQGVLQAIPIDTMNMTPGHSSGGLGFGQPGDPSFTLTKGHSHAVAHVVGALACNTGPNGHDAGNFACNQAVDAGHVLPVAQPITFSSVQSNQGINADLNVSQTLEAKNPMAVAQPIVAMRESGLGYWMEDTVAGTLDANMGMSGHANRPAVMTVPQTMAVRRLTPVECERLQGFPDNYTNIPWRKKDESPDGPRYKALGNSWAVPNVRWIGKRIQEALNALS